MEYKEVAIPVDGIELDGLLTWEKADSKRAALALHPHPLYGGDMFSPVVSSAYRALLDTGFKSLRFNFRGTPGTQNHYEGVFGALYDASAAIEFLHEEMEIENFGVVGYSFGGTVALALASRVPLDFLITVSASYRLLKDIKNSDTMLKEITCPVLMINGGKDRSVPLKEMNKIAELIGTSHVQKVIIESEDHLYHRSLDQIQLSIESFLQSIL